MQWTRKESWLVYWWVYQLRTNEKKNIGAMDVVLKAKFCSSYEFRNITENRQIAEVTSNRFERCGFDQYIIFNNHLLPNSYSRRNNNLGIWMMKLRSEFQDSITSPCIQTILYSIELSITLHVMIGHSSVQMTKNKLSSNNINTIITLNNNTSTHWPLLKIKKNIRYSLIA